MIGIIGAGAFGTSLAICLATAGRSVALWARDADHVARMTRSRQNEGRLPGAILPENVTVTAEIADLAGAEAILLALPMQMLGRFLTEQAAHLNGTPLITTSKGVDLTTLQGASHLVARACPKSVHAVLTGPSFAADIARGMPTALTLACADDSAQTLQHLLSTHSLRVYRSSDVTGAELGGALKNVMAIAAGIVIGAGLGDSARAALMTRGYAEMVRFAMMRGARAETLAGLSGFGDLVLTCTSMQSRNLRYGIALGTGAVFDQTLTVEGAATATAVADIARAQNLDLPIVSMVAAVIAREIPLDQAIRDLMTRPLKQE